MTDNAVIHTLQPGQKVQLVLVDGRIFKGVVVGNGMQTWVELTSKDGDQFTIQASRLSRCLGTLEVVE
jgi:hypothetical protein